MLNFFPKRKSILQDIHFEVPTPDPFKNPLVETHPRQLVSGWIMGDYNIDYKVKPGDYFYAVVGLLEDSHAGDVSFWVYIRLHGEDEWDVLVSGVDDWYDYKLKSIAAPIPPSYFGRKADFSLRVSTNDDPFQDKAVWVESRIIR